MKRFFASVLVLYVLFGDTYVNSFKRNHLSKGFPSRLFSKDSYISQPTTCDPLLTSVYINSKSGDLNSVRKYVANFKKLKQPSVCELGTESPVPSLRALMDNAAAVNGSCATALCIGGDGTIKWILDEADKLQSEDINKVSSCIQYGLIPSGTGNDLHRHLMKMPATQLPSLDSKNFNTKRVQQLLKKYSSEGNAEAALSLFNNSNTVSIPFDRWEVTIDSVSAESEAYHHLVQAVGCNEATALWQRLHQESFPNRPFILPSPISVTKSFNNYFGIGVDSQVTRTFSEWRRAQPALFRWPLINRLFYGLAWCSSSLNKLCATDLSRCVQVTATHSSTTAVTSDEEAVDVAVPLHKKQISLPHRHAMQWFIALFHSLFVSNKQHELGGLVFTNIGSFAGGGVLWPNVTLPTPLNEEQREEQEREGAAAPLQEQRSDDGKLELTGLKSWWHLAMVTFALDAGIALAQGNDFKVLCNTAAVSEGVPMQVDGEAWIQKGACRIRVKHLNKVNLLLPRVPDELINDNKKVKLMNTVKDVVKAIGCSLSRIIRAN